MNKLKENMLIINESDEQEVALMESKNEVSSDILFEDSSKRSENVKHFRMRNGQYMAAVYDKPVHSLDKATGKFVDIAHHFEEKDDYYEAKTNHFKARFPKKEGKRKFVTMEKDGLSVSWRYIPSTDSHKKHPEAAIYKHERVSLMELPSFPTLKYEKTESRTDLEYGITDRSMKENIILSKRPKNTTFYFELKLEGLRAVLAEDKSFVSFIKKEEDCEETVMVMPPILMIDGAGVISEAAHYGINEEEDMTVLSIVVDPKWLFSDSRIYPITIDPQVLVHTNGDTVSRSIKTVRSDNTPWTSISTNRVGFERNGTENRMFARYSIPELPAGSHLVDATLELHQSVLSGENREYDVYRVDSTWNNTSITWKNQPTLASAKIIGIIGSDENTNVQIDLTKELKKVLQTGMNTIGIAIKAHDGCQSILNNTELFNCNPVSSSSGGQNYIFDSNSSCKKTEGYIDFYSDLKNSMYSPRIKIRYTLVDEYADHQKTECFDTGRAGTGMVNLFTGKFSFEHVDASISSVGLPLSLSHIYRSDYIEAGVTDATFGKGWIFSPLQKLTESSNTEISATYCDATGLKHYFKNELIIDENGELVETICVDTAGLGLTFKKESHEIVDEQGNTLSFDKSGRVIKITNSRNDTNKFTYNDNNLLVSATDSIGRKAKMTYKNNKLESITYMGNKTKFKYQADLLASITYPDNQKTIFGYSNGYLNKITDQTGVQYTIEYESTYARAIGISQTGTLHFSASGTTEYDAQGVDTTLEYRERSTAVKNNLTNIKQVYCFDDIGRVITSYEDLTESSTLNVGELAATELTEYGIVKNTKTGTETDGRYSSIKVSISENQVMYPNYLKNGSFNDDSEGTLAPKGWNAVRVCNADGVSKVGSISGYHSYKFDNAIAKERRNKYIEQTVLLCGCCVKGNILIASAWAKASDPIGNLTKSSSTKFELYAKVTFEDGTSLEKSSMFDCECTNWQYTAVPLELFTKTDAKRFPVSATVRIDFSGNYGTCLVSNVHLTEANGTFIKNNHNDFETYELIKSPDLFPTIQSKKRKVKTSKLRYIWKVLAKIVTMIKKR